MIALEPLADGSASDRNFQKLMSLVLDTGGKSVGIRWGSDSVTFSASTQSAFKAVSHGLGRTPVVAFAMNNTQGITMTTDSAGFSTATTFNARGFFPTAITGTFTFYWVVIG